MEVRFGRLRRGARELGNDDQLSLAGFDDLNNLAAEEAGIGANRDLTDGGNLGKASRQQGQTHPPRQTASGGRGTRRPWTVRTGNSEQGSRFEVAAGRELEVDAAP